MTRRLRRVIKYTGKHDDAKENGMSEMNGQLAGWYPDPSGDPRTLRYWNGEQWTDDVTPAPPCGQQQAGGYGAPSYQQPTYQQPASGQSLYYPQVDPNESDRTLRLVAFVFCILSLVSVGWLIVPLIWMIPMTVISWGIYKGTKPNTVAFGVCTLIFLSLVAGILLLVSRKDA